MDRFLNTVKAQAAALDRSRAQPRFGIVTSVDTQLATVRVLLQPEGVLSGWLPIVSPWTGAAWGMFAPPSPGDQVLVLAQEGAAEHGVVVGAAFSSTMTPPSVQVGEFCVAHASGASIRLSNDGTVYVTGPITFNGSVVVNGSLSTTGDISDNTGSLARLRTHYNSHAHIDSRSGVTSVPNQQD